MIDNNMKLTCGSGISSVGVKVLISGGLSPNISSLSLVHSEDLPSTYLLYSKL